jgi:hypothetical protein
MCGGRVCPVLDALGCLLDRRVRGELRADQLAVERPVVFGVGGRMNARVPTAAPDVGLERTLLGGVEHVAGGVEEDHRLVLRQVRRTEGVRVLGRGDGETVGRAQLADQLETLRDGVMPESGGLGEHQDVVRRIGRTGRWTGGDREDGGRRDGQT